MENVEKYQQRLQAIAEKRRQQDEEERQRRETEEEWLKLAQKKRKSLRDQWLSEPAPPPPADRTSPPLQDSPEEHTEEEPTRSQNRPEEEEGTAEVREEEDNTDPTDCIDTAATHNHWQAGVEEEVLTQVIQAAEGHFPVVMTQRMLYESGQDGRSVLGMVAVQVERDPKTGATVVRSVAPVSAPSGAAAVATAVFDDGRKSVHAVGGSGARPSAEELGQILSVIDGVGMKVLLEEVTVTPRKEEMIRGEDNKRAEEKEGKVFSYLTHYPSSQDDTAVRNGALGRSGSRGVGSGQGIEECAESGGEDDDDEEEDSSMVVVREFGRTVDDVVEDGGVEYRMEEGPVTLTFLGYADAAAGQGQAQGQEDHGGMLTVERVIITDEGEERKLEPADTAPPQAGCGPGTGPDPSSEGPKDSVVVAAGGGDRNSETTADLGGEAGKGRSQEGVFQDIHLDGNGAGVNTQGERGDKGVAGPRDSASPSRAEGEGAPKRKTCQCCSVM